MSNRRFTTIEGVFTPCLLSILGVIMYLRLGWVVGRVGLIGALLIIVFANCITFASVLSMSSIISNIRIGTGGAYSIITKSLGLEAGGAIGIPLYISQAVSIAFYITGFAECWQFIFPHHPILMIALPLWLVLFIISFLSAKMAFRLQYFIMLLIGLSIVSIFAGKGHPDITNPLWYEPSFNTFWHVFAIFFPAVTGILAGASMSGELVDPRRSIPLGTLAAVGLSFVIYVALAFWFAQNASLTELRQNTSIVMELGRWKPLVIAGIMGATLSSALSMFVSSPRILLALGKHSALPLSAHFSHLNKNQEPTTAILFTALISLLTILTGTLDSIAGLLTMFFLVTYGMINLTVFIEQSISLASFRPSFRIPKIVSLFGTASCFVVMFIIDAKFSIVAIIVITFIYSILLKRGARVYSPDIRSGMLVFWAERFAKAASSLPYYPKIWKPNIIWPYKDGTAINPITPFVRSVVAPTGRLAIIGFADETIGEEALQSKNTVLMNHIHPLKEEGMFVATAVVQAANFNTGLVTVLQTLKGMFFPPNTFFYALDDNREDDITLKETMQRASREGLGIMILKYNEIIGFGQENVINLWIRRKSPNINLSVLVALQLAQSWDGIIRLIHAIYQEENKTEAYEYIRKLVNLMRMPVDVEVVILEGKFRDVIKEAPQADINIFGMQDEPDLVMGREVAESINTSVLFLKDSKHESALA